jgi:hypothetical protein
VPVVGGNIVDLLVIGLDLKTGREVHASDRPTQDWHHKGHNGDRTLVCALCYQGADQPAGPRKVALVPRRRRGGARQQHFAHPPGMASPGGSHSPETIWHATAKHQLQQWAAAQGAVTRTEALIPDRRRRSDVAITLAGGAQVALEMQLGPLSDGAWLARHYDYKQAGITDVWLWHHATWIPRVMFDQGQPGWTLDPTSARLGLVHASPGPATARRNQDRGCTATHWPPCPDDRIATAWMPLAAAQLTPRGIQPPAQILAQIARQSTVGNSRLAPPGRSRTPAGPTPPPSPGQPQKHDPASRQPASGQTSPGSRAHHAFKYESRPPWTDPGTWRHYCDTCNRTLTLAELKASPIIHIVAAAVTDATTGRPLVTYHRYGGGKCKTGEA